MNIAAYAKEILQDMQLVPDVFMMKDLDDLGSRSEMNQFLDKKICDSMAIGGDWRAAQAKGVDVYDVVCNFAEDNFKRIRSGKSEEYGWYLVIVSDKIGQIESK